MDPFSVNYGNLAQRDQNPFEEYDFGDRNSTNVSNIKGAKMIESHHPFEDIEGSGFDGADFTSPNFMEGNSSGMKDRPHQTNEYASQLRQSSGNYSSLGGIGNFSGGNGLTHNIDADPYNFGASPANKP
jgi:hypothetical protein